MGLNLAQFIAAALGITAIKRRKPRFTYLEEGEVLHRRCDRPVPLVRQYRIDRNRYNPKTCSRPKEAEKARRRANAEPR